MFDIGWSEFLVILVVILVVVGPKDLPRIVRTFGQWSGKARSYARDFQRTIEEAADETEMAAIRKEIEVANRELAETTKASFSLDGSIKLDDAPATSDGDPASTSVNPAPEPSIRPAATAGGTESPTEAAASANQVKSS